MEVAMYTHRFYRAWISPGRLCRFRITRHESDLEIAADYDLSIQACEALRAVRSRLEEYVLRDGDFLESLVPVRVPSDSPEVVRHMSAVSTEWGVGPMAAVAGAVADRVGRYLSRWSETVIVENGGDIYARSPQPVSCALYAGEESPFTGRIAFTVDASEGSGICTSSGTVGHSLSLGRASAVTVIARDCAEADAAATAIANSIAKPSDVEVSLSGIHFPGRLLGVAACCGDVLASRGVGLFPLACGEGA
jgi:ApbE superfamily uncharacterized protein (UPF0280 family)